MKILVTGAAGFIGYHLCEKLVKDGHVVIGLDNINDYYDVNLKFSRLEQLGIDREKARAFNEVVESALHADKFSFVRMNLEDRDALPSLFEKASISKVCNLAAQAGVRYSLENPEAYIDSNIVGYLNLLECCRHHKVEHLVYASSSSVYGLNEKIPFSTEDTVDHPISLYAASKKSNELMAHTYSHLFDIPTTGLRFFTVYGPWGRPDMALFLFTDAIAKGKPINVFNHGKMERDFTYVDDIVEGVSRVLTQPIENRPKYNIYNIGNNNSVKLMDFIEAIEYSMGKKAEKNLMPIQPGDVERTWADVSDLIKDYGYQPNTKVSVGVQNFVDWYKSYYI
ncbi:NAD-dependent epimerase [Cytophaga sp. FL35]|uniref:NAD-dependent epimerase n=1 Tax=Cytophaga sp. FL35 TaxID=1904456 RepID=UPI0016534768|nr:NAD-dependent epimerase [Cytophaga sp. FL35]MBC6997994.1 NAD-dependent epimerase [Cytophaga sp. FL35]